MRALVHPDLPVDCRSRCALCQLDTCAVPIASPTPWQRRARTTELALLQVPLVNAQSAEPLCARPRQMPPRVVAGRNHTRQSRV